MAIIGHFTKQKNGSYLGRLHTLTLDRQVTFEPLAKRGEKSPDYRITSGQADIGAAWEQTGKDTTFLSVRLDDPSFTASISCRLTKTGVEHGYSLIWERERKRS